MGPSGVKRHGRRAVVLIALWLATAAAAEESKPRPVQAGALMSLLRAPHPQIQGPALARIGPDVPALLVEYATSIKEPHQVRLRALAWLQWFPSSQSRAVLLEMLRARDADVPTIRVCLRALAFAFGAEQLPILRAHLDHADVYVREAAAYALGDVDDRRVRDILNDHLDREREIAVRDAIVASLQRLDRGDAARPGAKGPAADRSGKAH